MNNRKQFVCSLHSCIMQCFFSNLLCRGKAHKSFRTKILLKLAHLLECLALGRDVVYQYSPQDLDLHTY